MGDVNGAMEKAVGCGSTAVMEILHLHGADLEFVDKSMGGRWVHWAALNGHIEMLSWLREHGAQMDAQTGKGRHPYFNNPGMVPIHLAAMGGHVDVLEWLLKHGADADAKDDQGNGAAKIAARVGFASVAQWLDQKMIALSAEGEI